MDAEGIEPPIFCNTLTYAPICRGPLIDLYTGMGPCGPPKGKLPIPGLIAGVYIIDGRFAAVLPLDHAPDMLHMRFDVTKGYIQ
jgi:hypothetical protein